MQIKDIVRVKGIIDDNGDRVQRAAPETTLQDATHTLAAKRIGLLVVTDGRDNVVGVVSERDVVRIVAENGADALDQPLSSFMTPNVQSCKPNDHAHDIIGKMVAGGFRHMPVMDGSKLVGLISTTDIMKHIAEQATPQEQAAMWAKISWV